MKSNWRANLEARGVLIGDSVSEEQVTRLAVMLADPTGDPMSPKKPKRYLSRPEVADRIGVKPDTLNKYTLPEPDAYIGRLKGWLPETIDAWNDARPSRSSIYARMADTKADDDSAVKSSAE